jgi:hypothetical protein
VHAASHPAGQASGHRCSCTQVRQPPAPTSRSVWPAMLFLSPNFHEKCGPLPVYGDCRAEGWHLRQCQTKHIMLASFHDAQRPLAPWPTCVWGWRAGPSACATIDAASCLVGTHYCNMEGPASRECAPSKALPCSPKHLARDGQWPQSQLRRFCQQALLCLWVLRLQAGCKRGAACACRALTISSHSADAQHTSGSKMSSQSNDL